MELVLLLSLLAIAAAGPSHGFQQSLSSETFSDDLAEVIDAGVSIAPKIMDAIKAARPSSVIRQIVERDLQHEGLRRVVLKQLTESAVKNQIIPRLAEHLDVPAVVFEEVKSALEFGLQSAPGTWIDFKIAASDEAAANIVYLVDAVVYNRGSDRFDIIFVNLKTAWQIRGLLCIEWSKSTAGGKYYSETETRHELPRSITKDDLKVLLGSFHISVFKKLAEIYGRPLP